ncbi:MAG: hypothetical protein PHH14_00295 [Candidatus Margulisbacteria bacterium]|nr:hypothetical protein [Candidatus Margulisiibacteriota bacterium]
MLKRIFSAFFIILLLVVFGVSAFALVKGLSKDKQAMVKVGESVTIPEGAEVKSVVCVGGSVTIYGTIDEDVVCVGGSIFLKDSAIVEGAAVSVGGKVMKEPGAITKGDIVEVSVGGISPAVSFFTKGGILKGLAIFSFLSFIGFVALTMILVATFTPQIGRVSGILEEDLLRNFLIGLLIAVLFVPVVIMLGVSIVGIILIPVWAIIIVCASLFGYIAAGHLLGKKILHAFKIYGRSMMTECLTGVVLLWLIGLVPIGGLLVKLIASLTGIGAVYWTRFGTK